MSIDELVYKFELDYDKVDTQKRANLSIPQKLIFLNEAQRRVVNRKYSSDNLKGRSIAFEDSQKRIRELSKLVMPTEALTAVSIDSKTYSVNLATLSSPLLYVISSQSTVTCGSCPTRVLDNVEVSHNDRNNSLRDPYLRPDYGWNETVILYQGDNMIIESDGVFVVTNALIDYIRQPSTLDKAGYTHFDGTPSTNVDPELPDYVNDEIVTEAVILASNPIERVQLVQLEAAKQAQSE